MISERLSRTAEYLLKHPFVNGAHTAKIIKWLMKMGDEGQAIATAMSEAGLADLPKPRARYTQKQLQRCKRAGINLPETIAKIETAWSATDGDGTRFRIALAQAEILVKPGTKKNVFVATTSTGFELGALDRLMQAKRLEIASSLKPIFGPSKPTETPQEVPAMPVDTYTP